MIRFGIISTLAAGVILTGAGLTEASNVPVPPRVVTASSASGDAVFTIADMSPDTGVYAVQWVTQGDDFNSYQMMRATSKTITVPYLSCTRSYTLRVFVMAATWRLADGHQTQNVTAHSPTFDLTMPACKNVTSSDGVTSLSCAQGGLCAVGDTGPGGGIVFYVQASGGTFACGATLASTCKYLEAAPTTGTNSWTDAQYLWSGNTSDEIGATAQGTAVGTGYKNTLAMVAQSSTANRAGTIARAYRGPNNLSDWYLPSKDELNQMYLQKGTISGLTSTYTYWSSSENSSSGAWAHIFFTNRQTFYAKDGSGGSHYVRPVRAFG